jgi:hypothetical protein
MEFEILDADPRRVKRVRIHLVGNGALTPRESRRRDKPRPTEDMPAAEAANLPAAPPEPMPIDPAGPEAQPVSAAPRADS